MILLYFILLYFPFYFILRETPSTKYRNIVWLRCDAPKLGNNSIAETPRVYAQTSLASGCIIGYTLPTFEKENAFRIAGRPRYFAGITRKNIRHAASRAA